MKFFPKVRQAAKEMFDEFVENYAENYDKQDIHHEWHMALDYDANITFESIKIELITEYGFDETFKLVRDYAYDGDFNLVELPKDGIISYLYYFLMKHVVETEFGDVEEAVRSKGQEDVSCHICGVLPAPFYREGQNRCEEHNKDMC